MRGAALHHPFDEVIPDSERIGHNCEGRIDGGTGREEAAVNDVKIVKLVGFAMYVERGSFWIAPEPNGSVLVRYAGQRNPVADIQVAPEQSLMTRRPVNRARRLLFHQLFQFRVKALMTLLIVRLVAQNDLAISIERDAIVGVRQIF